MTVAEHQIKLNAITKDNSDVLHYVLQNDVRANTSCIQLHDLLVCMDVNAVKCFQLLYHHFIQSFSSSMKDMLALGDLLNKHPEFYTSNFASLAYEMNESFLRCAAKLSQGRITYTRLHECTWDVLQNASAEFTVQRRLMIAALLKAHDLIDELDEAIPQHLLLRQMRLKERFGETYVEPFSRESIDDMDPHLIWPSEDGYRFYHLAYLIDYINQVSSACYKDDNEVVIRDPISRQPLSPFYVANTYLEAERIIGLYGEIV